MVFFNYATMQMAAKIVYYGPGLCGKTTNLRYIYEKTSPQSRGDGPKPDVSRSLHQLQYALFSPGWVFPNEIGSSRFE